MVSQVLLATVWYAALMLHYGVLSQLRHLVWNFLCGGFDGTTDTQARIPWQTIILLRSEGGLGLLIHRCRVEFFRQVACQRYVSR